MSKPPACHILRQWRGQHDLSQEDAAGKVGVVRKTWHQWEAGDAIPKPEAMARLYLVTGGTVQPNDFYTLPALVAQRAA
jgi:transcriptional regulator with XRE-family HTH domain